MIINNLYGFKNNISFGYYDKTKFDKNYNVMNRNTTWFYRTDIIWSDLVKFLDNFYKDKDNVSIYNFGCSDGSEPYTLSSALLSNTKSPEKFFPIEASDCDTEAIETAKKGIYNIRADEKDNMMIQTRLRWNDYFETNGPSEIRPRTILKNTVNFSTKNVLDGVREMKKGPKIIMCRNFWPYLKFEERYELLSQLKKETDENSLLIIGSYDKIITKLDKKLPEYGFKPIDYSLDVKGSNILDNNVWQKI